MVMVRFRGWWVWLICGFCSSSRLGSVIVVVGRLLVWWSWVCSKFLVPGSSVIMWSWFGSKLGSVVDQWLWLPVLFEVPGIMGIEGVVVRGPE